MKDDTVEFGDVEHEDSDYDIIDDDVGDYEGRQEECDACDAGLFD